MNQSLKAMAKAPTSMANSTQETVVTITAAKANTQLIPSKPNPRNTHAASSELLNAKRPLGKWKIPRLKYTERRLPDQAKLTERVPTARS